MSSLPKRLRFEILKRDHFACVYCGQGMPAVIVEIDHVLARANGGSDDPSNLVTACFSFNRGKSDVPLDVALPGVTPETVEAMRLRVELMADYRRWQEELESQLRAELDRVWDAWADEFEGRSWTDDDGLRRWEADVAFPKDSTVLEFLRLLPTSEVLDAVRIAGWRWGKRRDEPIERAAVSRYFAGVCRNKARKADETARRIHVTWPELMERVPDLVTIHGEVASFEPSQPWTYCGDVLWTRGWTVTFKAGSQRVEAPKDRISGLVGPRSIHAHDDVLGSQTALDLAISTIRAVVPPCGQTCACGRPKRPPHEADYPRCASCGQVAAPVDERESCADYTMTVAGHRFPPVRYAEEAWHRAAVIAQDYPRYRRVLAAVPMAVPKTRCPGCRTPPGGIHHPDCPEEACPACGERITSGCATRGHRAGPLMRDRSVAQAMANLCRIKPRGPDA